MKVFSTVSVSSNAGAGVLGADMTSLLRFTISIDVLRTCSLALYQCFRGSCQTMHELDIKFFKE